MTDRVAGYLVVLAENVRSDDAEATAAALRQIRGVVSVEPVVANVDQRIAESRALTRMRSALHEFWRDNFERLS